MQLCTITASTLVAVFKQHLPDIAWKPLATQTDILTELISYSYTNGFLISTDYQSALLEAVNQKLDINNDAYQHMLDVAFSEHIKLNYRLKTTIRKLLDRADKPAYEQFLTSNGIRNEEMCSAFSPVSAKETLTILSNTLKEDEKRTEILTAIFSRFCFNLFDPRCTTRFFSKESHYSDNYFDFLFQKYPDLFNRNCALAYIDISQDLFQNSYSDGCNKILACISESFTTLQNHCDLIISIPDITIENKSIQWELYRDTILFAEKHRKEKIDKAYFRWKKIAETTSSYIPQIDSRGAEWDTAFQGFVFKDCFVISEGKGKTYRLLLIFEKNVRDERPILCPACRSTNIQGNSYPILNVRSWECENPLCPERSKYNRGKRYAFMSLIRQKQMLDEDNKISNESIARWHLDCIEEPVSYDESFEMCLRHYSCTEDGVIVYTQTPNATRYYKDTAGRHIKCKRFTKVTKNFLEDFKSCSYFNRFLLHNTEKAETSCPSVTIGKATIINGNTLTVMRGMKSNSIDGAVTSPPYYNAKEYSQWGNIYCYLYDMYNIATELYRILKPGAVYLFNIFDYFDNENNVALSAMGNKRMILGAYMLELFSRIGYTIQGNIIWYKGEIQGNRSFNQGNMTPYYQAPLNCWEHVFILSKDKPSTKFKTLISSIESIRPVVKFIRGKNVLGHTAPFPQAIPELLIKHLLETDTVFDPFLGSGTTSIVANCHNIKSIGTELNAKYFALCQKRVLAARQQTLAI